MRLIFFIALFFSMSLTTFAKGLVVKDFDGDGKFDKIAINFKTNKIDFFLSSSDYVKQNSLAFINLDQNTKIEETKKGFKLTNKIGDVLFTSYFRYNRKTKKMELFGIKRLMVSDDFTQENGESFYNATTKEYIAKWNSFDKTSNKVIALPIYRTNIDLEAISLNDFNDVFLNRFSQQSLPLYKAEISK